MAPIVGVAAPVMVAALGSGKDIVNEFDAVDDRLSRLAGRYARGGLRWYSVHGSIRTTASLQFTSAATITGAITATSMATFTLEGSERPLLVGLPPGAARRKLRRFLTKRLEAL